MNILATTFTKLGWTFTQVRREGMVAIYTKRKPNWAPDCQDYEVIIVRNRRERLIDGRTIEAHEGYPSDEEWGTYGWSYTNLESAKRRMSELCEKAAA